MKKNLIKTLLIGVTIGTALTGLASNSADACYLSHETLAATTSKDRVNLCIRDGIYYKQYKSLDYWYTFYDYDPGFCEHTELYCYDASGNPVSGFLRNGCDCYYFVNGKAIDGKRYIDGHEWSFDHDTHKGSKIS